MWFFAMRCDFDFRTQSFCDFWSLTSPSPQIHTLYPYKYRMLWFKFVYNKIRLKRRLLGLFWDRVVQYFVEIRALIIKISDLLTGTPMKFADLRYRNEHKNLRTTSDKLEGEGGGCKQVRKGRHPIMDSMSVGVVPNDIFASPGQRLHVLTGQHPNFYLCVCNSVADPGPSDPYVFGPPGSIPLTCGSGSFYHQEKKTKKTLDSYCLVASFWLFIFEKWCKCMIRIHW